MTEDLKDTLESIKSKIDVLTSEINENKLSFKKGEDYRLKTLENLSLRIDNLAKDLNNKYSIKEHILTYVIGAFAGGLIMGLSMCRRIKDRSD